jgi:chemotaxis protein CheY-P-specific phosphatase CheC
VSNAKREIISEVFVDIFEKLAFMFGDEAPKDEMPDPSGELVEASMRFTGYRCGTLGIVVPNDMCPVIAANILGMEVEDEEVVKRSFDALKEVLNVICGNLLTAMEGEEPVFDLTVPETRVVSSTEWAGLKESDDALTFVVDEHPVVFSLKMDE